jgi:outer membrane translocation and assembly module TamA
MFGWGGNGNFGNWGGGNGQLGFLSNQLNNDSGRELLMNAITSQGEASRSAIQNLATTLGQDFNLVNSAVQNVQNALQTLALQQAVSVPQIINSIQSGNQALSQQFCQCCCQTQQQIMAQGYENQIRTIEQTGTLANQANVNTSQIRSDIAAQTTMINEKFCDLEKRELQDKITTLTANNALLRSQIDNANQTASITGYVNSLVAPLQKTVDEIASKQLPTVPVVYPNIQAVNNTPYNGGFYGNGFWGNGFGNNIVF